MTSPPTKAGYGNRTYSWDQKLVFAMKPSELGNFLNDKLVEKFDIFHDPDMGGPVSVNISVWINPPCFHLRYSNWGQEL